MTSEKNLDFSEFWLQSWIFVEIKNDVYLKNHNTAILGKFWTPRILRTNHLGPLTYVYFSKIQQPS